MYCYKCGTELIDGARFCIKCGTRQPIQTQANSSTKSVSKEEKVEIYNLLGKQCPKLGSALKLYLIYFGLTHNCLCTEQRHGRFNLDESTEVGEGYARVHLVGHDNIEYEYVCDTETESIIARENGIVKNVVDIRPLRKLFINVYPKKEDAIIEAYKDDFSKLKSKIEMATGTNIKDIRDYLYGIVGYGVKTNTEIKYRHYAYMPSNGCFDKQLENEQVISLDMIVAGVDVDSRVEDPFWRMVKKCPMFVRLYVGGYYKLERSTEVYAKAIYNIEFDWKLLHRRLVKEGFNLIFNISDTQFINEHTILDNDEMERLAEIKKQEEDSDQTYSKGMPVWDSTPNGVCDCAVGECDCDGSIWN